MRRIINAIISISLFFSSVIHAASPEVIHEITPKNLHTHVSVLASDAMEGRLTGTEGERRAAQYVAEMFQRAGLEPAGDKGGWFQSFTFSRNKKNLHGCNVLARLSVSSHANKIIIVSAHVDHLGRGAAGGSRKRNNETGMIHAGADDNASGVASMIEVAARLSDLKKRGKLHGDKDILFAAFSGEELGVLGSSHFIKHQQITKQIVAVINLDMVGRLREKLVVQGVGSSTDWPNILGKIYSHLTLLQQQDPWLPTDSTSFYMHGIPALNFFTGAHDDYHTPRDTPDTLNYAGLKKISDFLTDMVLSLEHPSTVIRYHAMKKPHEHTQRGFKVYLGTIPDYASADIKGVKLSGVARYSPAERAGLKEDDVIIGLGGRVVSDIYDYTRALNALHAGKTAKMLVMRGKEKMIVRIVARNR